MAQPLRQKLHLLLLYLLMFVMLRASPKMAAREAQGAEPRASPKMATRRGWESQGGPGYPPTTPPPRKGEWSYLNRAYNSVVYHCPRTDSYAYGATFHISSLDELVTNVQNCELTPLKGVVFSVTSADTAGLFAIL